MSRHEFIEKTSFDNVECELESIIFLPYDLRLI